VAGVLASSHVRVAVVVASLAVAGSAAAGAGGLQASAPLISVAGPTPIQVWQPATDDLVPVSGTVTMDGAPVAGVMLRVGEYELPAPTGSNGRFTFLAEATSLARYPVSVADDSRARVRGVALTSGQRASLAAQRAAITVAYPLTDVRVGRDAHGDPTISGRITFADRRTSPPTVTLYTYQLSGTVIDASGKPVSGAVVSTRTGDRNYWTISTPTDAQGQYNSLFTASDESGDNPVPMNVEVAIGNIVYAFAPQEFVEFPALHSAHLDIRLPPEGFAMAPPLPRSYRGAVYQGVVIGVGSDGAASVRPLSATWPTASGRFELTLPRALAGKTVSLWEAGLQLFSTAPASPGSPIPVASWPQTPPATAALGLASVRLP
jgi:hypothetical protein